MGVRCIVKSCDNKHWRPGNTNDVSTACK